MKSNTWQSRSYDFVENGFKPGYQVGLENFDNIFSTYTKLHLENSKNSKHLLFLDV